MRFSGTPQRASRLDIHQTKSAQNFLDLRSAPMLTTFALYIHRSGDAPKFEPILCSNLIAAMTKARDLLEREASICAIEIQLGDACVVTVERPEA